MRKKLSDEIVAYWGQDDVRSISEVMRVQARTSLRPKLGGENSTARTVLFASTSTARSTQRELEDEPDAPLS